jgi:hypothetical protein
LSFAESAAAMVLCFAVIFACGKGDVFSCQKGRLGL